MGGRPALQPDARHRQPEGLPAPAPGVLSAKTRRRTINLFVTGTSSFIGKALLAACDARGHTVTGVDLAAPDRSGCHAADIRDRGIAELIPESVDAVVHLAALSRDPDCRNRATDCFDANVMGTLNLIDAAEARGARQFVFASSEWVYDHFVEGVAKTEDDVVDAAKLTSEYAFSKYVSEINLRQKARHGFCPVTILRFGIIYGPRRENWSAVESLLNTVATKDEVTVGALATARRFVHVADIAEGILAAVGQGGFEIVNLQGRALVSLGDVIETSKALLGRDPKIVESNPAAPSIRMVDGDKARALLGWQPRIGLEEGLETVIDHLGLQPAPA